MTRDGLFLSKKKHGQKLEWEGGLKKEIEDIILMHAVSQIYVLAEEDIDKAIKDMGDLAEKIAELVEKKYGKAQRMCDYIDEKVRRSR